MNIVRRAAAGVLALGLVAATSSASAQDIPRRTIMLVVGFAPGGASRSNSRLRRAPKAAAPRRLAAVDCPFGTLEVQV